MVSPVLSKVVNSKLNFIFLLIYFVFCDLELRFSMISYIMVMVILSHNYISQWKIVEGSERNNIIQCIILLGTIYTRGGSPQDRLGDVWTYGTILASAYVLHCLSVVWLQFLIEKKSSKWSEY